MLSSATLFAATPIKSDNDDRLYQSYTLPNKMKVLLVSDANTRKAAASLDVYVGSKNDPENRQGLAHFLEHMLFLGTSKYPKSGDYQAFISSHGGGHNAYTSFEHTNYFFDVDEQDLEPALDRFSQFFVAPLFNQELVAREINAVHSEYKAKLKADARRSLDVFKSVINPAHPFSKLSVGNLTTLHGEASPSDSAVVDTDAETKTESEVEQADAIENSYIALREQLLAFYNEHYSASRMALVVIGSESLVELKAMVDSRFAVVANNGSKQPLIKEPLFLADSLPSRVTVQPEKSTRSLAITFPIPDTSKHYRFKPTQYIGNILGHEGEGSLLSLLKARGWAETLSAGQGLVYNGGATFNVSISLSKQGLQHTEEITAALFHMINKIKKDGLAKWRHQEQTDILDIAFRYQEKGQAINYASHLASSLQEYPSKDVLRGDYLLKAYKPRLLKKYLSYLTPDNALYTVMAKGQAFDKTSPWYDTPYSLNKITSEAGQAEKPRYQLPALSAADQDALQMPVKNIFIAKSLELKNTAVIAEKKQVLPTKVAHSDNMDVWWAPDSKFSVPKTQMYTSYYSNLAGDSPRNAAMLQLVIDVLNDKLNEFSYPAMLAGVHFQLSKHMRGISLRVGGYDDSQERLLSEIATAMKSLDADPTRLNLLHSELLRRWGNASKALPYRQLFDSLHQTMLHGRWGKQQLIEALASVTPEDLESYWSAFKESAVIDAFAFGNVTSEEAIKRAGIVNLSATKPGSQAAREARVVALPASAHQREISIDHSDSALVQYHQAVDDSAESQALVAMTVQMLQSDFFQQLRTQQQLGYIVFATGIPMMEVPGLAFVVQSPTSSVEHVEQQIGLFLKGFTSSESNVSEAAFKQQKLGLLSELQEQPKNLSEQGERYWGELTLGDITFSRRDAFTAAVESLSRGEWLAYYDQNFVQAAPRQLSLWSKGAFGQTLGTKGVKGISDVANHKDANPYFSTTTVTPKK